MYQALYRKWRPQVFSDVVGQQHITQTLKNEIQSDRHSHAYLFTGSRGTGKTTCAKIFAKAVNCEHPVGGDPCNTCETCRGIDSGSIMDVIEIDAASNNGVDNIRDIRDEANFTPVSGKYRVYIIDEVHMLSTGAFNALLKTLEEPPKHVKFVLATTEVHKLPATILSRCQRFDFKRITPEDISQRLAFVAEQEGLSLDPEAAMLIARLADGALRDALVLLDQCMGHNKNITVQVANDVVGLAGRDYLFSLSACILKKDAAGALKKAGELHNRSCDMVHLCGELINHFRNIMICKAVENPKELIICSEQELNEYKSIASAYSMDRILEILDIFGDTLVSLRKGVNRRVEMEMSIIKLCSGGSGGNVITSQVSPTESSGSTLGNTDIPIVHESAQASGLEPSPVFEVAPEPVFEAEPDVPVPDVPESVPIPDFAPIPAHEPAPEPAAQPPGGAHVSLSEPLPDGPIPTHIWNAIIREVVSTDKALIGTMNSAKAVKRQGILEISTDNVLLKRFAAMDEHKQIIYNATFTVMGEYLKPVISESPSFEPEAKSNIPPEPETTTGAVFVTEPVNTPDTTAVYEAADVTNEQFSADADPLDDFIKNLSKDAFSDFNFYIEE